MVPNRKYAHEQHPQGLSKFPFETTNNKVDGCEKGRTHYENGVNIYSYSKA